MPDIDQTLLTQQAQEKELREAQLAAQNREAQEQEAVVSIAELGAKREKTLTESTSEEPEEMEAELRAEQLAAQNREAMDEGEQGGKLEKIQKAQEQIQKIQKTMKAAKGGARTVNFGSAATLIGLVITFILMNAQLLLGNLFGVSWVPKLEVWEIVLVGVLDLLVFLIVMTAVGLLGAIVNPLSAI